MAISFVNSATASSTSLTMPTGRALGDVELMWAYRSTAATVPTVPTGWRTIASTSGSTNAGVLAYRYCTSTSDTSGTWTGATQLICVVYRGVLRPGASATSTASSTSISYPALTMQVADGSSWVVGAAGHRTASNVSTAPTGMTNETSVGAGPQAALHDTAGGVSAWSAQSVTVNANSGHESITCELLADPGVAAWRATATTAVQSSGTATIVLPPFCVGDLLVVTVQSSNNTSYTAPAGWTIQVQEVASLSMEAAVLTKIAVAGEANPAITQGVSSFWAGDATAWANATFNAGAIQRNGSAASCACPAVTSSGHAMTVLNCETGGGTYTTPAGFAGDASTQQNSGGVGCATFWKATTSANPGAITVTVSATSITEGIQYTLNSTAGTTIVIDGVVRGEFGQGILADLRTTAEPQQGIETDNGIPTEQTAYFRLDGTSAVEADAGATFVRSVQVEHLAAVDGVGRMPVETLAGLVTDVWTPAEWLGTAVATVIGDAGSPIDWGISIRIDSAARPEFSAVLQADGITPSEALTILSAQGVGPADWLRGLAANGAGPVELLAAVRSESRAPAEISTRLLAERDAPLEWLANSTASVQPGSRVEWITSLCFEAFSRIELTVYVEAHGSAPAQTSTQVFADAAALIDWIATAGLPTRRGVVFVRGLRAN